MLNLTLTPDADTASVLARVTTNSTGVTLVRADQNGTVPVRLQEGQALESGVLTVRDYEAALVGPVTYIATTTAPAEVRRNLMSNPTLASNTAGWSFSGSASRSTATALSPSTGVALPRTGSSTPVATFGGASRAPVTPGAVYSVSALTSLADGMRVALDVIWYTAAGAQISISGRQYAGTTAAAQTTVLPVATPGRWGRADLVAPANAAGAGVRVYRDSGVDGTAQVTQIMLEQAGELRTYFDGSTPGAQWVGVANGSASVIRAIETLEVSTDLTAVRADMVSVVAQPQYVAAARVTVGQAFARPTKSIRHDIIGRPDPIFTLRRGGFRTGTVRVMVEDLGSYEMFDALQQQAAVCLFRFAAHERGGRAAVDFYAVIEDLSSDTAEGTRALDLTLRVAEVRRPSGYLLGALGWTYAALAGLGITYAAVPANFNTYADLAIGTEAS